MVKKVEGGDDFDKIVGDLRKELGDGSIQLGMDAGVVVQCESISTRCMSLDAALGIGGVPKGRIVEIYGPEGSGKTTLALEIVAEAQSKGGRAAYIDVEHACDPKYMAAIGVDLNTLIFSQPDSAEDVFIIADKLIKTGKVSVIVVDSVAAMATRKELEGEVGDQVIGALASLMSKMLRKLISAISGTKTCIIFINQLRDNIGMNMPGAPKEHTPGGRALKYYASVRLDIRRTGSTTNSAGDKVGNETRVKVVKNKLASPFKEANFCIVFGKGISTAESIIDMAVKHGVIERTGSTYGYNSNRMGLGGIAKAVEWLENSPEIMQEIKKKTEDIIFKSIEDGVRVVEGMKVVEGKVLEEE